MNEGAFWLSFLIALNFSVGRLEIKDLGWCNRRNDSFPVLVMLAIMKKSETRPTTPGPASTHWEAYLDETAGIYRKGLIPPI